MNELAPEVIYKLLEHPDVRPSWAPDRLYLTLQWPAHAFDRVKAYGDERGAILLFQHANDQWSWHWACTRACSGKGVLLLARKVLIQVFTVLGADAIHGAVPRGNRAARTMSRAIGALPVGQSHDRFGRPCINYRLERGRWATLSAM